MGGGGGGGARTDGRSDACDVITKPKFLALMGLPKSLSYGSPCVQRKHDPKNCTENWFVFLFLLSMLGFFLVFFFFHYYSYYYSYYYYYYYYYYCVIKKRFLVRDSLRSIFIT